MRRLPLLIFALVASASIAGCHYHDYRDYLYEGDLSRDTHGAVIYQMGGEAVNAAPVMMDEHHHHHHHHSH